MPFFVEDQSGNHIYVINDVTSFEIKKSITAPPRTERSIYSVCQSAERSRDARTVRSKERSKKGT